MGRILVIDDQKISRLTLVGILGDAGHDVRAEATGPAGIEVSRTWVPDVIILDVHMPEMDGFEVVSRLKKDPITEAIPVVFLTGDPPTDELIVRGLDLGAYDFLSKGCSKAELIARVSVMERIKRNHDELASIARISDALLRSVEPESIAEEFVRAARSVFRAGGAVLAVEWEGQPTLRVAKGFDAAERAVVHMLRAVGSEFAGHAPTASRILDPERTADRVAGPLGTDVGSAGAACVHSGASTAMVVITAREAGLFRDDVDEPLLRNLTSQVAIAIEHALLNRRNRRQAEELERAMNERSRFFASLSHELRTPINAVIGYNHLLREKIFGELSEAQGDALAKANRSAQHLLELVDDILDISKIEAGKLEIFPEPIDVPSLLRDTATSLQLQAKEKGIELKIDAPPKIEITTDPARLRQIVLNLLSNAVKFTDEGRVDLRLREDGSGGIEVRVEDTGPGIAPEDRDRIFEEFEQTTSGDRSAGTGLGLAISRRIAQLLGGSLLLESEVGTGSTFILTLPTLAGSDGDS
jgi:signal transduction histidine kinase/CheY-like chemotaxis protein